MSDWIIEAIERYFDDVRAKDEALPRLFPNPTDWLPWPADDDDDAFLAGLRKKPKKHVGEKVDESSAGGHSAESQESEPTGAGAGGKTPGPRN